MVDPLSTLDKNTVTDIMYLMNNTLTIYRGFPASGKSTIAAQWLAEDPENRIEINRDNTRNLIGITGRIGTTEQEKLVTKINDTILNDALNAEKDIVISDTNLRAKYIKNFIQKAKDSGYNVEIRDFNDVSLEELIARDANRNNGVGEDVIRTMWMKFPYSTWKTLEELETEMTTTAKPSDKSNFPQYINNPDNPHGILVDVDGTIAHHENIRSPYDFSQVIHDTPDTAVIEIVNMLHDYGKKIIIMSGRSDICHDDTVRWLNMHGVKFDEIHMRRDGDTRADWIVKDNLVREFIENNYYIEFCLDDRNQVVDHHRAMGYKVLQVQPGDF